MSQYVYKFPIAIHKDEGSDYGVIVPNLPGCHSWGTTIEEAFENTKEAIEGHVETLLETGEDIVFACGSIEDLQDAPDYAGASWYYVEVDLTRLLAK
ncbi:toxin-antitoxin system HicB-like [Ralstonia phage RSL2]|uniref:HicB-like antitoxin of toxin-antitoxin system domain-containing protein n=1 Tax=Ralstonia phage RSL2 TaxID=1585840 RepID=A0A0A8JBA5_9CAUD|nr:toxin-antitoxin system HicB-like [Ralstonia phage RSL2]BAQ02656.1 hypothetical protein [Ralstonia phage RSL2]